MRHAKSAEKVVQDSPRKTRRRFAAEEKIRIVLEGMRGEESIAALCRREGLNSNLSYRWSKEFLEGLWKEARGGWLAIPPARRHPRKSRISDRRMAG